MFNDTVEIRPGVKVEASPHRWGIHFNNVSTQLFADCLLLANAPIAFLTFEDGQAKHRLRVIKASGVRQSQDDDMEDRWDFYLHVRRSRSMRIGDRMVEIELPASTIAEIERVLGASLPLPSRQNA